MVRALANDPGDLGSIPGQIIPKSKKMVLDTSLLNTPQYKVRIKGSGAIQGKELHLPLRLSVEAVEKGAFGSPSTTVVEPSNHPPKYGLDSIITVII